MKLKDIGWLVLCIFITLACGGIGGYATATEVGNWYTTIEKPFFNPPNYLFGPVWSALYFLLGFALFAIIRMPQSNQKKKLLFLFTVQMILNVLWSFLFFSFHQIGVAAIEMFVLWLFILAMIVNLFKISSWVALLQVPYFLWVTFAFVLNCSIYFLNVSN